MAGVRVQVGGRALNLSNLDKVLYPDAGLTKGQVVDYYARIAPVLLPHLRGRPLTLKRYPHGVGGPFFYEKRCPRGRPDWFHTEPVSSGPGHGRVDFCVVTEVASLVWLANLAALELHTSLSTAADLSRPTVVAFDLDPGAPADIVACCKVALLLRRLLERLGLEAFAKTSGSKGLQVYLPLNTPHTYDQTKGFARAVALYLEERNSSLVVSRMTLALRAGKVLVDWSQNDAHKTTVCVYSLRARARPTVSTPVSWDEVEATSRRQGPAVLAFEVGEALARVSERGDLFAPVLSLEQRLPAAFGEASGRRVPEAP